MTAVEKAKELLWKYLPILESWKQEDSNQAKQFALIAVDEIINTHQWDGGIDYDEIRYWEQVKHEIINL